LQAERRNRWHAVFLVYAFLAAAHRKSWVCGTFMGTAGRGFLGIFTRIPAGLSLPR